MRFQDMNWMQVDQHVKDDNRLILVTGSTEQHAFLSLAADVLLPMQIAMAVSERTGVLVAPPLNFGVSGEFAEFPGTIGLSEPTFYAVVSEIVESLMHQGFRRFFVINGKGANKLPPRLDDLQMDGALKIVWHDWWLSAAVRDFEDRFRLRIDHANWSENFPVNRVADLPPGEKKSVNLEYLAMGKPARTVLGDGSFGGRYQIDDKLMDQLFKTVVDEVTDLVERMRLEI